MLLLATLPIFSLSYHAVNVDKVTAAAMTAAYASEAEMEAMNTSNLQKIVDHYKSATVATKSMYLPALLPTVLGSSHFTAALAAL